MVEQKEGARWGDGGGGGVGVYRFHQNPILCDSRERGGKTRAAALFGRHNKRGRGRDWCAARGKQRFMTSAFMLADCVFVFCVFSSFSSSCVLADQTKIGTKQGSGYLLINNSRSHPR